MAINLASRVIRLATKDRKIELGKSTTAIFGIIKAVANFVGGLLSRALRFFGVDLIGIFQIAFQAVINIATFDWNSSDAQIDAIIAANNLSIIAQAGTLAGNALASTVCVGLGGIAEARFPVIRGKLLAELAKSGGADASILLRQLVETFARNASANMLIKQFKNIRKYLRSDDPLAVSITNFFFGANAQSIREKWGVSGEPYIISNQIEESIEAIPNDTLRTFTESLIDEFGDRFTECLYEGVYIIQQSYDDYYAVDKYTQGSDFQAPELIVDLQPSLRSADPSNPTKNEIIRVTAPNSLVLKERINTVISDARLISNRDMGVVIGQPLLDYVTTEVLRRQIVFTFRSVAKPPWKDANGKVAKTVTITVPEPKTGLRWDELKILARPFIWGKFSAVANLEKGRKIKIFGATAQLAEEQARKYAALTTLQILTINVTEEAFKKNLGLLKQATQIYPEYATLLVRKDNQGVGRTFTTGETLVEESQRITLWTDIDIDNVLLL